VPMERPRSAWARAAGSLTPSQAIATTRPRQCRPLDHIDFVRGEHVRKDRVGRDVEAHLVGHRRCRCLVVCPSAARASDRACGAGDGLR
jgi:hypothetical protein